MDNLKNFIDNNRDSFDEVYEIDMHIAKKLYKKSSPIILYKKIIWSLTGVAAAIVLTFVGINSYNNVDSLESQLKYYENTRAELIDKILETSTIDKEEMQSIIEIIIQEAIPMVELIPEYVAEEEKIEIIQDYENRRLLALNQLLNIYEF